MLGVIVKQAPFPLLNTHTPRRPRAGDITRGRQLVKSLPDGPGVGAAHSCL